MIDQSLLIEHGPSVLIHSHLYSIGSQYVSYKVNKDSNGANTFSGNVTKGAKVMDLNRNYEYMNIERERIRDLQLEEIIKACKGMCRQYQVVSMNASLQQNVNIQFHWNPPLQI